MNIRPALATLALVAVAAPAATLATAGTAHAGDGDVVRRGSCTGSTDWKLKAKPDDGRFEVEGEVDSNRNGQTWRWRFVPQRQRLRPRHRHHPRPSGSFEVTRRMANLARHRHLRVPGPQPPHRRGLPRRGADLTAGRRTAPYPEPHRGEGRGGAPCA